MERIRVDAAVFGGGIAGLWTLRALQDQGIDAVLIEREALGGRQTLASQGMLHRGGKYVRDPALREMLRDAAARWDACLSGTGSIDLRGARVLSPDQFKWWTGGFLSRFLARAAAGALEADSEKVPDESLPAGLRRFRGSVYRIAEKVVDVKSVLGALPKAYKAETGSVRRSGPKVTSVTLSAEGRQFELEASAFLFCAGEGNEKFAPQLGLESGSSQRRPLKQILVKPMEEKLYGHCFEARPAFWKIERPLVTITTHGPVWYLGGDLAETGCRLDDEEAIRNAFRVMTGIFPETDWTTREWAAFVVDRAEAAAGHRLPEGPQVIWGPNWALAWPTKLVLAPLLADRLAEWCGGLIRASEERTTLPLAPAEPGSYPWETDLSWRTMSQERV